MKTLRWGILGAAKFALEHMGPAIHAARGAQLVALATSSAGKADPFKAFAPGLHVHDSYDALLADPDIDAVYIPLPNHMHVEWTLKALEAGKHVLCEKPMALNAAEFDRLIAARDASGLLAAARLSPQAPLGGCVMWARRFPFIMTTRQTFATRLRRAAVGCPTSASIPLDQCGF